MGSANLRRALGAPLTYASLEPQGQSSEELRTLILGAAAAFREAAEVSDKEVLREQHRVAKYAASGMNAPQLLRALKRYRRYFPLGERIRPELIEPVLVPVTPRSAEEALFKLCRASWSMPYSKGYGRRLRFVVMDAFHDAVIGIVGLQSAPADLACRDDLVGPTTDKLAWVNATLDAYTIGAVSPYSDLLGGKLVAGMVGTEEVRQAYWRKYAGRRSQMEGRRYRQPLLAVTTTSAFGRSSIYNRLRHENRLLAEPIGYTKGYGTVHLEAVYPAIVEWLKSQGTLVPAGFGNGPKVRWQNVQNAITQLKLPHNLLSHGLQREVFLFRHVENWAEVCRGVAEPVPLPLKAGDWASYWKHRWALPRATSTQKWRWVSATQTIAQSLLDIQAHRPIS